MADFTLDTSGSVSALPNGGVKYLWVWGDLSPFAQAVIRMMFKSFRGGDIGHWPDTDAKRVMRFDRLAPEALALLMKDCAAYRPEIAKDLPTTSAVYGTQYWAARQAGMIEGHRRLTAYIHEDGKVYLKEGAAHAKA